LNAIEETLRELTLPHPEPFVQLVARQRAEAESLLQRSGVKEGLAKVVSQFARP